jgi:hypothetical protein
MTPETHLVSFVLRFVYDRPTSEATSPATRWHGVVRHVQSNEELHFTRWADAVAFIERFAQLDQPTDQLTSELTNSPTPRIENVQ